MKSYSFLTTILLVNGVEMVGWDDTDDSINMNRLNDSAAHVVGNDGEMTVNLSADLSGEVVFNLMQSSTSNAFLSGLISSQENGAFVPIFVQFKDTQSGDLVSGTQGYIPRPASMSRGRNAKSQEWRIVTERLDLLHVGS